ncbi:MAG TPA: response regulator [Polyangiaceae bacterium]|jgi:CheY-like chemotaxis protein
MTAPHILIIDDDADSREAVRLALEDAGYHVTEAGNGRHGLEVLEQVHVDLVLLDLRMPVMSGAEFIDCLERRGQAVPYGVVAMSGFLDARRSPAKWFLPKPLDFSLLLAVVADFCGRGNISTLWAQKQKRDSLTAVSGAIRELIHRPVV